MLLAFLFFATALLYACAGFGGGSTYNALLVLHDTDYRFIPLVSLICNIIVVTGGVWHFSRSGHIRIPRILPWVTLSVPMAWLGGYIAISEKVFVGLLGSALFISGIRMLLFEKPSASDQGEKPADLAQSIYVPPAIGAALGLLAGVTGIGGGIFLAPVLHFLRWGNAKEIAGICSLFILVNSVAGLIGQGMKLGGESLFLQALSSHWALFPSVFLGGQIGSLMGASLIKTKYVKITTAILILYVSAQLLYRFFGE